MVHPRLFTLSVVSGVPRLIICHLRSHQVQFIVFFIERVDRFTKGFHCCRSRADYFRAVFHKAENNWLFYWSVCNCFFFFHINLQMWSWIHCLLKLQYSLCYKFWLSSFEICFIKRPNSSSYWIIWLSDTVLHYCSWTIHWSFSCLFVIIIVFSWILKRFGPNGPNRGHCFSMQ